jgi:hypothetical protein
MESSLHDDAQAFYQLFCGVELEQMQQRASCTRSFSRESEVFHFDKNSVDAALVLDEHVIVEGSEGEDNSNE